MVGMRRSWLTGSGSIDRRTYFLTGVTLALLKYAGDVALIRLATRHTWTPANYLDSTYLLYTAVWEHAPGWLLPALSLWTVPFLWIGVVMTLGRCRDAGLSPWFAFVFFIPYVNYLQMLTLSILPGTAQRAKPPRPAGTDGDRAPAALTAILISTMAGLAMVFISVRVFRNYGVALFFGGPFIAGAIGGFIFNRRFPGGLGGTIGITTLTFGLAALILMAFRAEGLICLVMAVPILGPVAVLGAALGRAIARHDDRSVSPAMFALLAIPLSVGLEPVHVAGRTLHEVQSSVVIEAPPGRVWPHVMAFAPMHEPLEPLFRLGIASPQYARIEGAGVGAIRYCVFSTGAFVEPITAWEPNRRLAFDVASSPPPLRELSFYRQLSPPHLDGYLRSRRGEFRLVSLEGGRTRLEGSTWYELEIAPEGYWQLYADYLIHRIHARVLEHIKSEVELKPKAES
jgi:uncharacterized membrane protein YhaH (DUF805 family)